MAADQKDTIRKIEKAIVRRTLGNLRASLHLFDSTPFEKSIANRGLSEIFARFIKSSEQSAPEQRDKYIIERISSETTDLIQPISEETSEKKDAIRKIHTELLSAKRITHLFELVTEIRLEKILKDVKDLDVKDLKEEQIISRLRLFTVFLKDFILYYPHVDSIEKENIAIQISDITVHQAVAKQFVDIYRWLITFENEIENEYADLSKLLSGFITFLDQTQKNIPIDYTTTYLLKWIDAIKDDLNSLTVESIISEEKRNTEEGEKLLAEEREKLEEEKRKLETQRKIEEEREAKEREKFAEETRKIEEEKEKLEKEREILEKERLAEEERKKVKEEKSEENQSLPIDKEHLLQKIKTFLMEKYSMSEEDAIAKAEAVFQIAVKNGSVIPQAPELLQSSSEDKKRTPPFMASLADALRNAVLRKGDSPSDEVEKQINTFISDIGSFAHQAVSKTGSLRKVAKIPKATRYGNVISEKHLEQTDEIVYVLSVLPTEEALEKLDNGYILIGKEKSKTAKLYYFHKGKKDQLVICDPGDLTALCTHASTSLKSDEEGLKLTPKQQLDMIIRPCGGHNHKLAKDAALAESSRGVPPVLVSQSSITLLPRPPKKQFDFSGYDIELIKDGEDFPENLKPNTLYFKWDKEKNTLTVKHLKINGGIFDYSGIIKLSINQTLLLELFEDRKKIGEHDVQEFLKKNFIHRAHSDVDQKLREKGRKEQEEEPKEKGVLGEGKSEKDPDLTRLSTSLATFLPPPSSPRADPISAETILPVAGSEKQSSPPRMTNSQE